MKIVTREHALPAPRVEGIVVPTVFRPRTLHDFEDASASIPIRQLDRAFAGATVRLGDDPSAGGGARREHFRRYVASVDQSDAEQLQRLGRALGALIGEVAASKRDYLVTAAERDGFVFANGAFAPAVTGPGSFAVTRIEDVSAIDERARRLHLLANESPRDAVRGAVELVESICRVALLSIGEREPARAADLGEIVEAALGALENARVAGDDATNRTAAVRTALGQCGAAVARLGDVSDGLTPRHARFVTGAAAALGTFVAESYRERAAATSA